jgi:glucokinase
MRGEKQVSKFVAELRGVKQSLFSRGLHAQVTGGLFTLNNTLGGVYIAGGFTPK